MNRIRFWREKRGLSQAALARLVGMSQPNLARIETGQQQLTEGLMQRFAQALEVEPIDLLSMAIVANLRNDVVAEEIEATPQIAAVLRHRQIRSYRVCTNAVQSKGFSAGDSVLIDTSAEALAALSTGDVVVAEVADAHRPGQVSLVLREYIAPALLTTNRPGTNHAFRLDDEALAVRVIGVAIPPADH